jgi:hypothetical protein
MTTSIDKTISRLRQRMVIQLERDEAIGEVGRLIADAEEERDRHVVAVAALDERAARLDSDVVPVRKAVQSFFDRPRPDGLDGRAARPKAMELTPDQVARGVVIAFETANPTFLRAVIDRLLPGEKVRNVTTNHKWYEYSRDDFERLLPRIAASDSYQKGSETAPGKARYVTGRPPAAMEQMIAPDWAPPA